MINKKTIPKIYIADHRGMVGSAILRALRNSWIVPLLKRWAGLPRPK